MAHSSSGKGLDATRSSKGTSLATSPPDDDIHTMSATKPTGVASSTRLDMPDVKEGEGTRMRRVANYGRCPAVRAACTGVELTKPRFGEVDLTQTLESLRDSIKEVQGGDLSRSDAMLVSQADALDGVFHLLLTKCLLNSNTGYTQAAETYMRLALKAQSQARATWETISKIHNPIGSATFVKQANIANGPQQVNNRAESGRDATSGRDSAGVRDIESQPNELKGVSGHGVDAGATRQAVGGDTAVGSLAERHGSTNAGG